MLTRRYSPRGFRSQLFHVEQIEVYVSKGHLPDHISPKEFGHDCSTWNNCVVALSGAGRPFNRPANQDESPLRIGDARCRQPSPARFARYPRRVLGSNPQYKVPAANKRICRPAEQLLEFSHSPAGHDVRLDCLRTYLLKSLG